MSERSDPEPTSSGLYVRRGFLSPLDLTRALAALERLSAKWASSEGLGLLGRGRTTQVLATDIAVRTRLDEIGRALAGPTLAWARACGFPLPASPHIQLFPVRMVGDAERPAYQDPHIDSDASRPGPPICTSVFYVKASGIVGGDIVVGGRAGERGVKPKALRPSVNTLVSFAGDRVHWVEPLLAGERLSVVINAY